MLFPDENFIKQNTKNYMMPQVNYPLNIYIQITLTSLECLLEGIHSCGSFLSLKSLSDS